MRTGIATRRDESHRVLRLKVFGSATHGTSFDPATSTADFLMEFDRSCGSGCLRRPFAFQDALAAVLDREVDLPSAPPETSAFRPASTIAARSSLKPDWNA